MTSIPTPHIAHLSAEDYEHIYEPAEDSFILLDALETDATRLRDLSPSLCIEIGSGSGIVSAFLSSILGSTNTVYFTTDINIHACHATNRTAEANNAVLDPVRCHLLRPFLPRIYRQVDVLVFNPPYVPTDEDEHLATQSQKGLGGSWAGGIRGMTVTQTVIDEVSSLLAPGGLFYLVAVEQNIPADIIRDVEYKGIQAEMVLKRRAGRETLSVIRFERKKVS